MEPLESKLNLGSFKKVDLDKEYQEALKDPTFKKIVDKTKLKDSELKNYTSILEECSNEYKNCMECKGLIDCKNRIKGHVYFPTVQRGHLDFEYKNLILENSYKTALNFTSQKVAENYRLELKEKIKTFSLDKFGIL